MKRQKTPLLLLSGLLCDKELWHHQRESLKDIAEIIVPDLTQGENMEAMAEQVLKSAPDTFALAGLSMGGYLALEVMRQAKGRVEKLALLGTNPGADTEERKKSRQELMELAKKGDFLGVTPRLLPRLIHASRLNDESLTSCIYAMAKRVGREAFFKQEEALIHRRSLWDELSAISCPTLILCGRDDLITPVSIHEKIAAAIPHATLLLIGRCGHLSSMERPEMVNSAMRAWLQG